MLSPEHRKLLVVEQGIVAFVINVLLNGGIAWLLFRSVSEIPLWGEQSVGGDLMITSILLPVLSCIIVSKIVGNQVRDGKIPRLPDAQIPASGFSFRASAIRGLFLGACALLLAASPVVAALHIGDAASFESGAFIAYKAVWAGLLAGVISPVIAWWALADASRVSA